MVNISQAQTPLTNTFTYQGELKFNNALANGSYDFEFSVFDVEIDGTVLETVTVTGVNVTNGVFTTPITLTNDLFMGNKIWLDIAVRLNGTADPFDALSPRQEVTSSPYAIHAQFVDLSTIPSWNIGGNAVTNGDFIGTTNASPFIVKVNNNKVFEIKNSSFIGTLASNIVMGFNNFLSGGSIGTTISGGYDNIMSTSGSSENFSTIAGGTRNRIDGYSSTISGGSDNIINGTYNTISGGINNQALDSSSTVSGGSNNIASNQYATVPGGLGNVAGGYYSFAAGRRAIVRDASQSGDSNGDEGTFVWADSTNANFTSTGPNQFLIRATGGVGIGTNNPNGYQLNVNGSSNFQGDMAIPANGLSIGSTTTNGHVLNILGSSYFRNDLDTSTASDLVLGGSSGNATDDGVLSSDLTIGGSDLFIKSNDAVLVTIDANNDGDAGRFEVRSTSTGTLLEVQESGVVNIPGSLNVTGNISKGGGTFKIDHPLDPKNKYLYHSFIESPDMMNVYNGNITTDKYGEAWVQLPEYFEALNRDFRYQLTVVGVFAQAIVGEKIFDNRFLIKTNQPSVEVSWQVTGIRQDAYAKKNRVQVEVNKPESEIGTYLYPDAWEVEDKSKWLNRRVEEDKNED